MCVNCIGAATEQVELKCERCDKDICTGCAIYLGDGFHICTGCDKTIEQKAKEWRTAWEKEVEIPVIKEEPPF